MTKIIPTSGITYEISECDIRNNGGDGVNCRGNAKINNCTIADNTGKQIKLNGLLGSANNASIVGNHVKGDIQLAAAASGLGFSYNVSHVTIASNKIEGSGKIELLTAKSGSQTATCDNISITGNILESGSIHLNDPNSIASNGPVFLSGNKATKTVTGTWTIKEAANSWN